MRAAIYIRVSTDEQAIRGYSAPEQEDAGRRRAREIAGSEPLEIEIFADLGVSGATLDRPELARLREWVRDGRIDIVVTRDPDRLSRRLAHQLLLTEEFEKAGVRLEFIDFTWQDTPEGRLFYSIRGAIAEYEREKIRERTVRGRLQKAKMGGFPVRVAPYGYDYDPETDEVKVNEAEAAVVRDIFNWFVSEDIGATGIANRLNDLGIPSKNGKKWHQNTVTRILSSETYAGVWHYNKYDCGTGLKSGQPAAMRPREEWIPVPVPPIVDRRLWEKAQEKLAEARRLWAGRRCEKYLLSGLVSCAECGRPMHGEKINVWGRYVRMYTCRLRKNRQVRGCIPQKLVYADDLEAAVWEKAAAVLNDPEMLAGEILALQGNGDLEKETGRLEKSLQALEKGREAILDALAAGLVELDAKTRAKLADLKSRKERLLARKRELEAAARGAREAAARLEELRALAGEALGKLDELSHEEKRALVRELVGQVMVSGSGRDFFATVYLKAPAADLVIFPAGIRN